MTSKPFSRPEDVVFREEWVHGFCEWAAGSAKPAGDVAVRGWLAAEALCRFQIRRDRVGMPHKIALGTYDTLVACGRIATDGRHLSGPAVAERPFQRAMNWLKDILDGRPS